ncbi:hypothetical protein AQUCO_12000028v1 [Aquilegia coerulea]|uniref:Uncharacterized protein n=1 Tax=Aquilegia coerulea TaxID=218851 RepID=A0A2G5C1Y2_AQUCA|nr:hypothetical protein AQUCO_12000028v1 [Aquilegia coerulea]
MSVIWCDRNDISQRDKILGFQGLLWKGFPYGVVWVLWCMTSWAIFREVAFTTRMAVNLLKLLRGHGWS